jgi:uncharacterized protein DUF2752
MTATSLADNASPLTTNDRAAAMLSTAALGCVSLGAVTGVTPDGPTLCPFRVITGFPCPFCGTTRSLFALGHGDLGGSVDFSPLGPFVAGTAVVVLLVLAWAVVRERALRWPRPLLVGGLALIGTAWVLQLLGGVT